MEHKQTSPEPVPQTAPRSKASGYLFPWTPAYWRAAAVQGKDLKVMVAVSMMVAMSVVLTCVSDIQIPLGNNLRIRFDFLANAVAGMIGGPIVSLGYGLVADLVAYFIHPFGAYFPGYTLSSMLGAFVYALFFYRSRITIVRVALCKLSVNLFINVLLGSVWSAVQFSKGYWYYLGNSIIKNSIMLPIEIALLVLVLGLLVPIISRFGLIPKPSKKIIPIW